MTTLHHIIAKHGKSLTLATILMSFSTLLLMIRVKLNHSLFLLFLVWNVFLAIIPYAITMCLSTVKLNRLKLLLAFVVWLAFLPNAPYLITDLKHLKFANPSLYWLDVLVLFSYAITGLTLFYLTVMAMEKLVLQVFKSLPMAFLRLVLCFLCAFGMYLGRVLRYNSWELISQPQQLLTDILDLILHPKAHYDAWLFTGGFGLLLWLGYWAVINFRPHNPVNN